MEYLPRNSRMLIGILIETIPQFLYFKPNGYDLDLQVFKLEESEEILKVNPSDIYSLMMGEPSGAGAGFGGNVSMINSEIWAEMIANQ